MMVKANVSMMAITMAVMMTMRMMVINTGRTSDDTGDSWTRPVILILCNLCKETVNLVAIGNIYRYNIHQKYSGLSRAEESDRTVNTTAS